MADIRFGQEKKLNAIKMTADTKMADIRAKRD